MRVVILGDGLYGDKSVYRATILPRTMVETRGINLSCRILL
jgi:hypothetical protein